MLTDTLEDFAVRRLRRADSFNRLPLLLSFVEKHCDDAALSWRLMLYWWDTCDGTGAWRPEAARALRALSAKSDARRHMEEVDGAFYDSLPDQISVYRGAAFNFARGLSWTTDLAVAEKFAAGIRGSGFLPRILATASIPKDAVFFASASRKESEVVLDPKRLRRLQTSPRKGNFEKAADLAAGAGRGG